MKAINLILFFALLISYGAMAQNSPESDDHGTVIYDPLFWKEKLALRNEQSRKIEQINTEFYDNLRQLKVEQPTRVEMSRQLEQGLQTRSQKIWETLMPKQRRKLEKIIDKTMPVMAP